MRKSAKTIKKLAEEIEKTGIVQMSCAKVGLSTSTYYRWYGEDLDFKTKMDSAINIGRKNMTDFAESKMIKNINDGQERAIEFYLRHNDDRYRNVYGKELATVIRSIEEKNEHAFGNVLWLSEYMLKSLPEDALRKIVDDLEAQTSQDSQHGAAPEDLAKQMLLSGYVKWLLTHSARQDSYREDQADECAQNTSG